MAYNLQPLITILQQILNPEKTRWIVAENKPQLQSLVEKAVFLRQVLESSSVFPIIESLDNRIRDAAHKAEDIIECNMVDQLLSGHGGKFFTFPTPDLQQLVEEFDSITEQVVKIVLRKTKMSTGSSSSGVALLPHDPPSSKNDVVVGFDEDLSLLKDRLTGYQSKLEIIPITGMGGIGKTTLARTLYEDPLIVSHFDVRAWTTISQDYNVRAILFGLLLRPKEELSNELTERTNKELKEILYKRLNGRRFLIVLDDMWSSDFWEVIKRCFPDNGNGSRIMLTTRDSDVAEDVGTWSYQHKVPLLQESESWKLFCQIVFGEEDCPDIAFVSIGRKIAGYCRGLPLSINVTGGLLSNLERSIAVWEKIGATIAETNGDQLYYELLSLSYNHLQNHLKPCLLYLGAFPKDYEIKGSRLIYMWIAEGFVKPNGYPSLEEEAEYYLKVMVERNLLVVTRKKSNGKAMSYGMNGLLSDLWRRKAREEKFVRAKNERVEGAMHNSRRVSIHTSLRIEGVGSTSLTRSFICFTGVNKSAERVLRVLRYVRVLDILEMQFKEFPREILWLVNLRYLAFSCHSGGIPREISRLWNLQTLIGKIHGGHVSCKIWEMYELRHLKLDTTIYIEDGYLKQNLHEKLQIISFVNCDHSVNGFLKTIPNIKELGIYCSILPFGEKVVDLSHLHKLQTLRCQSDLLEDGCHFLPTLRFPSSLRKLTLIGCVIFPRVLTTLGALPNLEVLKIEECEFENGVFEATEDDGFHSLRLLSLYNMKNLVRWTVDETNFPILRELVIGFCPLLEEIPSSIGDIPTLQLIEMEHCSPGVEASAKEIEKVQQDEFDNYYLRVSASPKKAQRKKLTARKPASRHT